MTRIKDNFSGDYDVMRVIFSTDNPIETLYNLHNKYSTPLFNEYLEYLDVHEELQSIARAEQEKEMKSKQAKR
jgi:hypothetical protein